MHSLVRTDENLCARSMTCLVQLSALSGDTVPGGGSPNIAQEYVNIFIARFLQLFSGGLIFPFSFNFYPLSFFFFLNFSRV